MGDRLRRIRVIGEVVFSPSIEKRCLGFRGRETCSPVLQGRRTSSLRNSGNGVRLGVEGRGWILFLRSPDVPVVSTNARELTCPGEVRFCRCTPTDSRTTFIACRIYGVFALATETRGKYKFVPRRAEIFRLEIYFLGRFSSFFLLEIEVGLTIHIFELVNGFVSFDSKSINFDVPETRSKRDARLARPISFDLRLETKLAGPSIYICIHTNVFRVYLTEISLEIELVADIDLVFAPFASKTCGNVDDSLDR